MVAAYYETSETAEYVVDTLKRYVWVVAKEYETHSELQEDDFGEC